MEIQTRRLVFDPQIEPEQVSPSAVDLRLGNSFLRLNEPTTGVDVRVDLSRVDNIEAILRTHGRTQTIADGESFEINPGDFVLAYTLERIELPNYLAARIEGRSSLARLGVSIHQTAPTVHATFNGQLRLEISNLGPFTCLMKPRQSICQLILERLGTPSQSTLQSGFQGQRDTSSS